MRTAFVIACLICAYSAAPGRADELQDLQQRVDDMEMRLNDLELERTAPPRFHLPQSDVGVAIGKPVADVNVVARTKPVPSAPPKVAPHSGDDCEGLCEALKSQRAVSEHLSAMPNCPAGALCTDGLLLRGKD